MGKPNEESKVENDGVPSQMYFPTEIELENLFGANYKQLEKVHGIRGASAMWRTAAVFYAQLNKMISDTKDEIKEVEGELVNLVRNRVAPIAILIVAIFMGAVIVFIYTTTKDVNSSVISLQKDIISAQNVIRTSEDELQEATRQLTDTRDRLEKEITGYNNAKAKYDALARELEGAIAEYNTAKANYDALADEVGRLIELLQNQEDTVSSP